MGFGRPARVLATAAVLAGAVTSRLAATEEHPACRPSPELAGRLAAVERAAPRCRPEEACWQQRLTALDKLRRELPDNVHVHRAYQNAARATGGEELVTEYRGRRDRHPEDPLSHYLLARSAQGEERTEAAEAALAAGPDYPWAHLAVVAAYSQRRASAAETSLVHLKRFMELCPANVSPVLAYAGRLGEATYWRARLPGLRRQVAAQPIHERLRSTSGLWRLEFQLTPPEGHPEVRRRIRGDLEALEELEVEDEASLLDLLATGWELVGDQAKLKDVHGRQSVADACSLDVMERTAREWAKRQGVDPNKSDPTPEQMRRLYDATTGWLETCPDSLAYWIDRMSTVRRLPELPNETVLAEIAGYLAVWEKYEDHVGTGRSPYRDSAELLLDRGHDLDRVLGLIARERGYLRQWRAGQGDLPETLRAEIEEVRLRQDARIDLLSARAEVALGRIDDARESLRAAERAVGELVALSEQGRQAAVLLRADLLALRAELALAEERRADAVALWRRAAAELPPALRADAGYDSRALEAWRELGGSEESFALLSGGAEMPAAADEMSIWTEVDRELKPFELVDLEGQRWTRDDLAGAVVLVNVWATWCAPCRAELPHVQRLREELEGDTLRVVTFNVDSNPGLVLPYMEAEGLELDVLLAERYIMDEIGGFSIPLTWIVDGEGRIRREQSGFLPGAAEAWLDEARQLMEALAASGQ